MISKQVPHTYIQHSIRFFALFVSVRSTSEGVKRNAHNFYIFDENGFCWLQMIHIEKSYVLDGLGNGFFKTRPILEIEDAHPGFRNPLIESDIWIQGSSDRGFALETIREALGLNITYLREIVRAEKALREEQQKELAGEPPEKKR